MNYFSLNSIRKKILVSNGIMLVILLGILIFSLMTLDKNQQLIIEEEVSIADLEAIVGIRNIFMEYTHLSIEFVLLLQDDLKNKKDKHFIDLKKKISASKFSSLKKLIIELNHYELTMLKATAFFLNNDKIQGSVLLKEAEIDSIKILTSIGKIHRRINDRVNEITANIHEANNLISFSLYALLITLIAVGSGISIILANIISRPINKLHKTIEEIEQSGDLTKRVDLTSNDEIGSLAVAFNRLVDNLANIVREVTSKAIQLADSSAKLTAISVQSNLDTQKQSDEVRNIVTAINQMSATVAQVASSAELASTSADDGNKESVNGSNVVKLTISAIDELSTDVKDASNVIEKLKGDSENISTVLDVIKTIAEQTNLLALNAAIEAARAGENGRGFAVVADEVRTLAQRTQDSTTEIETLVDTLQSGSKNAHIVMEKSREKAQATVAQASEAGISLEAIEKSVESIQMMNAQIATATEEQSATTTEIEKNIHNIQSIAEKTAAASEQTAKSCNELNEFSEQLRSLVGQFKV